MKRMNVRGATLRPGSEAPNMGKNCIGLINEDLYSIIHYKLTASIIKIKK